MKSKFNFWLIFIVLVPLVLFSTSGYSTHAYAQSDDLQLDDDSMDFNSDDFGTDDMLDDSKDSSVEDSPQVSANEGSASDDSTVKKDDELDNSEVKVNDYGEVVGGKPEDVMLERKKEQLNIQPGLAYEGYVSGYTKWTGYLSGGMVAASVDSSFSSSDPLPQDYVMLGAEVDRHFQSLPMYMGFRLDQFTESSKDSTQKMDYSLTTFSLSAGYKVIDSVISISGHGGLLFELAGSRRTKVDITGETSTASFKIGFAYCAGIRTLLKYRRFQGGLDAGIVSWAAQKAGEIDLNKNSGGYVRGLVGIVF